MPEGPEIKISSNYLNKILLDKSKFQIISSYYSDKYSEVFKTINSNLINHKLSFTIERIF